MNPKILRISARGLEEQGHPIAAGQMNAAALEIERLTGCLNRIKRGVADPQSAAHEALGSPKMAAQKIADELSSKEGE